MSRNRPLSQAEQIANLHASLRTYKALVRSQQRQIARLTAENPLSQAEREVMRLEQLVLDLLDRCIELEGLLRRQHLQEVA